MNNFKLKITAMYLLLAALAAAPVLAAQSVRIESMSCSGVPTSVMTQAMESEWADTGASCISCMACGCSCIAEGVYVADGLRIDATRVSCEGKTYTLVAGKRSYKCDSVIMKPADTKKKIGGPIADGPLLDCEPLPMDWSLDCFAYPGASLVSQSSGRFNFDGDAFSDRRYIWKVFVTGDKFEEVNSFFRSRLGQEVRAVMANAKPMAVFPIRAGNSSVTVTSDERARKVYITVFKYESGLD